jgi:diketogulonate reductase-like aldo/keto reductase
MDRRACLDLLKTFGVWSLMPNLKPVIQSILTRKIPASGEMLPAVGIGTWQTFDVGESDNELNPLREVLEMLVTKGGRVVDSSPMYGRSEETVGNLSTELKLNKQLFIATKVWTHGRDNGIAQMNESFRLLRRNKIDLIQVHNLGDWKTHLITLRRWKEEGKIKYIGITHYLDSAHEKMAAIIDSEKIDFIQVNYNMLDRGAENKLLPFAAEKKVAVLVNRPFEEGALFQNVKGKVLPRWAAEFDCQSWGQFFLKYILSNAAVTCVIPGTSKPHHMADNLAAGYGKLPDDKQRQKMIKFMAG